MSATYQETLDYLYDFVNFEHRRLDQYSAENFSLDRVYELLELLGNPHESFRSIHIAGTKGKGSVAMMCAATLSASGLKTALYTSPHLQDFRDRIRILSPSDGDGRISKARVVELVERLKPATEKIPNLTWYEQVTAIAFLHFSDEAVDIAVVEVGLGGRLDASNVLTPLVSVITSLSFDHTYLLGNTLADIAIEKAGIIKTGVPAISSPQRPEALAELERIARERNAKITVIGREWAYEATEERLSKDRALENWKHEILLTKTPDSSLIPAGTRFSLALAGRHQQENAVVAMATLDAIKDDFPTLTITAVKDGLAHVVWPGRMQVLTHGLGQPTLLADCAHNVDSARKLVLTIQNDFEFEKLILILGATADKDVKGILSSLLPIFDRVLFASSGHPRASDPGELARQAAELGFESQTYVDVAEALRSAWSMSQEGDLICVTGSIFLVGDLLNQWESLQSQPWVEK